MASQARPRFRSASTALLRAAANPRLGLPPWPDLDGTQPDRVADWVAWLQIVWASSDVAETLEHASPALARTVRALCEAENPGARETRRAVLSVARYLQRMTGRATPFGLLAGVASVSFGTVPSLNWGTRHQEVAWASAQWLAEVIARLEACPALLARLPVVANSTMAVRGDRLVVPYQPLAGERETGAAEVSLRYTAAVRTAVEAVAAPTRVEDLAAKICAEFPVATPPKVTAMLTELVTRGALITSLHAPGTEPDALGHLIRELDAAEASGTPVADLAAGLKEIRALLEQHNRAPAAEARAVAAERMRSHAPVRKHPLALDLRLDVTAVLPHEVAREAERAALALTRLAECPVGLPTWTQYHQKFYERYGAGALVPLLEVVADSGIGWPDGYPGTITPAPRPIVPRRDEALLALAQAAALDGAVEVPLDDGLIAALELRGERWRLPPHLELGVRVRAANLPALQAGDFLLEVVTVSRAAGVLSGRFLNVLHGDDQLALAASLSALPANDGGTVTAQLSFPPLDSATTHVIRTPQILPTLVSMAEHRPPDSQVLTPADLAVGCDGRRMYLAAPARGRAGGGRWDARAEPDTHTPPLARFLSPNSAAPSAPL